MRGKVPVFGALMLIGRITPAYAGKSTAAFADSFQIPGSPPPMRGKDHEKTFRKISKRITPAYAGKSAIFQIKTDVYGDHPRLCGEKRT